MEDLLKRYICGEVSTEEKERIACWLDENPENRRELLTLRKLYDISLWKEKEMPVAVSPAGGKSARWKFRLNVGRLIGEMVKVAAFVCLGFWGAGRLISPPSPAVAMQTVRVPAGQRVELTLADGTCVWLNAHSTLKFPEHFTAESRRVELDGEGYFSVRADKKSPFIVQTEQYAVRVLGTEFNVKAYRHSDRFETALVKGSVEVALPGKKEGLRLQPNDILSVEKGKVERSRLTDLDYFKWKEGLFCFRDETIGEVIEKLQFYYDVRIEVRNRSLLSYRYSGKFRIKDGIEHVLKVLQLKHAFTYTKNEKENLIIIE